MKLKKLLCILSGDDYGFIVRSKMENRFSWIGLYVLIVFAACFISSYFTFVKLFPNYWVGVPIALFFAWMITNIYLLLLYTLSKNVLPHKKHTGTRLFSLILRIAFISLIAILVSKPLEALIFAAPLSIEVAEHKRQKLAEYNRAIEEFFAGETKEIKLMLESQKKLEASASPAKIKQYEKLLMVKENQKNKLLSEMTNLVENANFYIYGIVTLNTKYPACWLLTLISVSIFLAPAVLKNLISENSAYYRLKREFEVKIVRGEYLAFRQRYRQTFLDLFGVEKNYIEHYLDPPFNTVPITDTNVYLSEGDLIAELYDD